MRRLGCVLVAAAFLLSGLLVARPASAHEGHDHDKPPPLALPVAPRVVAVTPDFELVGVASGKGRLTVFLHAFATNEPIKGAALVISADEKSIVAKAEGDGVFTGAAPWLETSRNLDLVFALTLADGTQDLLTGQLQSVETQIAVAPPEVAGWSLARIIGRPELALAGLAGLVGGVLLGLLVSGSRNRRTPLPDRDAVAELAVSKVSSVKRNEVEVTPLRKTAGAVALIASMGFAILPDDANSTDAAPAALPSVPSTMATDLAQGMPDGTLFVPKATQHLLSIRTILLAKGKAAVATELTGTVVAGPGRFGRVQPGRPGRIEASPAGLAYVGKRVEKGELLAYVQAYVEAADRANMDSLIAETEARIEKNRTILSRYEKSPGSVPQVKEDEVRGELEALTRKRAELLPSAARREPIVAPIGGVISLASATVGQIVDAKDVLFEIVDPSELWVEATAYDATAMHDFDKAFAITRERESFALTFMGRGLALRQQATVLTFKVSGTAPRLAIGSPVKVAIQSNSTVDGFVLPASAVVRGKTGLPIVWIKTDAERFEPQVVRTAPLDGTSVVVAAGLKEDQRIVTDGVTLLNQVR